MPEVIACVTGSGDQVRCSSGLRSARVGEIARAACGSGSIHALHR